jgi:hypothetical protein
MSLPVCALMDSYCNVLSTLFVFIAPMLMSHLLRVYTSKDILLCKL